MALPNYPQPMQLDPFAVIKVIERAEEYLLDAFRTPSRLRVEDRLRSAQQQLTAAKEILRTGVAPPRL